jgi:hypothetical protein
MTLRRIKGRSELLEKILSAFSEAEAEGMKDPLSVFRKVLEKRAHLKTISSHHNTKK